MTSTKMRSRCARTTAIHGFFLLFAGAIAQASPVIILPNEGKTLDTLLGKTFQVADKDFSVPINGFINLHSDNPIFAASILVKPVDLGPVGGIGFDLLPAAGISFATLEDDDDESSSSLSPSFDNDDGERAGFTLAYTVVVNDPAFKISDTHLDFVGTFNMDEYDDDEGVGDSEDNDDGYGSISISESYTGVGLFETLTVLATSDAPTPMDGSIFLDNLQDSLSVFKTVELFSLGGEGDDDDDTDTATVTIDRIRQTFTQTQIPEPATAVLLGTGMLAFCAHRGARRK